MISFIVLIILSSTALTTIQAQYTSTTSSATTTNSQTFTRPGQSGTFYYQAIEVRVPTTGQYVFRTSSTISDTYGYMYQGNFYPTYPQYNLVGSDDDGAGAGQFQITATLRSDLIYYLIFTSYAAGGTGTFDVTATGPGSASMNPVIINN